MAYFSLGLLEKGQEVAEPTVSKIGTTTTRVTANTPAITTINVSDGRTLGVAPPPTVPVVIVKPQQGVQTTIFPNGQQVTTPLITQNAPTQQTPPFNPGTVENTDCPPGQFFANKTQGCIPIPGVTGTKPGGSLGRATPKPSPSADPIYEDNIIPGGSVAAASGGLDWKVFAALGAIGLTMFFVFKKDKSDAKV